MATDWRGRRSVEQADYDQIRALHAEGLSRNKIAQRIGRSGQTVSKLAKEMGLSFDRAADPQLQAAQQARATDATARRTKLQVRALDNAQRLAEQMFSPATISNFGGKDNTYNEKKVDEPLFRDKRDLAVAIQALTNSAIRLAEYDKTLGSDDQKGMLGLLRDQLRLIRDTARTQEPAPE